MSELDDVACTVIDESDKAWKLRDNNDSTREAWFPKSEISFKRRNSKTGDALAEIPLWLLKSKGWDS